MPTKSSGTGTNYIDLCTNVYVPMFSGNMLFPMNSFVIYASNKEAFLYVASNR